jgi:hypothetical protein
MTASRVTRVEVIDHRTPRNIERGRVFTARDCAVELSYQDDGRTLKVFVNDPAPRQCNRPHDCRCLNPDAPCGVAPHSVP